MPKPQLFGGVMKFDFLQLAGGQGTHPGHGKKKYMLFHVYGLYWSFSTSRTEGREYNISQKKNPPSGAYSGKGVGILEY